MTQRFAPWLGSGNLSTLSLCGPYSHQCKAQSPSLPRSMAMDRCGHVRQLCQRLLLLSGLNALRPPRVVFHRSWQSTLLAHRFAAER